MIPNSIISFLLAFINNWQNKKVDIWLLSSVSILKKTHHLKAFILTACIFLCAIQGYSYDSSLFDIDEERVKSELKDINDLESFLTLNQGLSFQDIIILPDFQHINFSLNDSSKTSVIKELPLGIPPFFWGFCLSIPGVIIVYAITEDEDNLKKAMMGCIPGTAIIGGCVALSYGLSSW
ncbi:MAG: hypothetical protein HOM80_08265 [Bacteroidetes bacterium]|nr:hypothetical protein [Bacteroidota bacterium]